MFTDNRKSNEILTDNRHLDLLFSLRSLTASPLVFTASLPKQKHSRAKSRQLRRLPIQTLALVSNQINSFRIMSHFQVCFNPSEIMGLA